MTAPTTIEIVLPAGSRHLAAWPDRHARGEVPSAWPYGLDELAWYADEVRVVGVGATRRWHRLARPLTDLVHDRRAATRPGRDIGLTWDEQSAVTMVTRRRHAEMYSGAIWINDRLERGEQASTQLMVAALREMAGVWALSSAQVEPLRRLLRPGQRVAATTFGVDVDFFPAQPWPDAPLVLSLGGDRDRDWATLRDGLQRVQERRPGVAVVVQGASGDLPATFSAVSKLPHREVPGLYARASVVAVATRQNLHVSGMTVGLEALASGRPLVITDTPGVADYFSAADSVSVPIGDAEALAEAVIGLLDGQARARALGAAGRAHVESACTTASFVAELAAFLELERRVHPGVRHYALGEPS